MADDITDEQSSGDDPAADLRRLRLDRSSASLDAEEELLLARQKQLAKLRDQIERTQGDQRSELARIEEARDCLLYTSPSPRDGLLSRMPSSA